MNACRLETLVRRSFVVSVLALAGLFLVATFVVPSLAQTDDPRPQEEGSEKFKTETIRGHFVWMAEAQERLFGVRSVPEAKERVLALETTDGELVPLAEDVRGRAFRVDERLRDLKDCELVVRRFPKSPTAQILQLFSYEDGVKYEVDYYCQVCSITMFELKKCECCQGDIELRKRPAK